MKQYQGEKVIVSLASYGKRIANVPRVIFSILRGTEKSVHIVLTIRKDDVSNITEDLQTLINNDILELIVASIDLKPHNKYFYVMKKYRNVPIITIDDDNLYFPNLVEDFLAEYQKEPKMIFSRLCREMTFIDGKINKFENWIWHTKNKNPSRRSHALGAAGVFYPPNCLKISDEMIPEILATLRADDIYLNVLEIRNNLLVKWIDKKYGRFTCLEESKGDETALSLQPDNIKITNDYIKLFEKEFNSCA